MSGRSGHRRIVFVGGWAAHRHVGDDAILQVHLDELRELQPRAEPVVLGADPAAVAARFGVRAATGLEQFMSAPAKGAAGDGPATSPAQRLAAVTAMVRGRAPVAPAEARSVRSELIGAAALIVLGAGSLASKFAQSLWAQAATVEVAHELGIPVAVAGVMLGPVNNALDAMFLRRLVHGADLVSVRDRTHSPAQAQKLGIGKVQVEWDPAARMSPAAQTDAQSGGIWAPDTYAVLCVGHESWRECVAAVDALHAELGLSTIGMPMDFYPRGSDVDALHELRGQLSHPEALRILDPVPPDPSLVGLIARARVAFGSRYHMAVFAAAHGTPSVLVHFDEYSRCKAEGLADFAGSPLNLADAEAGPEAIRKCVLSQAARRSAPAIPAPPLPAIDWLAPRLRD